MDLGISGRVGIVAGASKGLGRGVADALADEGVDLVICARGPDALEAAAVALRDKGVRVRAVALDVSEPDAPARLVAEAIEAFGRLDIVVSNSGGPAPVRALDVTDEQVLQAVESNLLTHVRFVKEALPRFSQNGYGRVVAIASYGIIQALPNLALSNLARTGLRAWAKTAAYDLLGTGVTLNLLAPGRHLTDRIRSLGESDEPSGDPADFGRIAAFLCSTHAGFVNGATLVVDGGATLAL